ncbi:MAG: restriction endonuclease subunit S [Actinobacteria bacterium]|nr:restriction endonuclease subunit S [Actinomycetota bacterium]
MTLPRYPEYRASGVEWLGEVPAHWVAMRLRDIASFKGGGTPSKDVQDYWAGDIPWLSPKDFGQTIIVDTEDHITDEAVRASATSVRPAGEVFLVARSGILKHTIPVAISSIPLAINQDVKAIALNSHQCINWFFVRWVQGFNKHLLREWCKQGATVESLEHQYLEQTIICLPPLPEQHAIVAYLDRETARIDDLIDKKRLLLALLKERRTAIITHAVTKGLPTEEARAAGLPVDPPMKDSGVEWLGEVPAHWSVGQLRQVMSMKSGLAITSDNISETGYYPVYGGNGIRGYTDRHTHDGQFVLIGRQGALCGNVHFVNGQFWASEHAVAVTIGRNLVPRFSYYLLGEMNLNQYSVAAAQPGLAVNRVLALLGVLPPPAEQHAIVAYLDRETARIDELTAKVEQAIELLGEYRTALITAAVTGQVDVRGAMEA